MSYGVQPTGFVRKPLPIILAEIELAMITEFGPDVIQSAQSPLGQINGLMADLIGQTWEIAEGVYQSYDPDQAEGMRLDTLARIRLLLRGGGESDEALRRAITNQDQARHDIQDLARAVRGISGVTYTQVFVNDTNRIDENNLSPGTIAIAVLGGDDSEIAETARRYIAPGISTYGNIYASTEIDGLCRTIGLVRPILVPVTLNVTVRLRHDRRGCPAPSVVAIRDGLVLDTSGGATRFLNGDDVTLYRIRSAIESRHQTTVEVISMVASRDGGNIISTQSLDIGFIEMAVLLPENVTINVVP